VIKSLTLELNESLLNGKDVAIAKHEIVVSKGIFSIEFPRRYATGAKCNDMHLLRG
jgi:hypothetical protein